MKMFTILKTGYTAGVYGNTGEYFTLIYTKDDRLQNELFYGQYGAEDRVAEILKKAGYKDFYSSSSYGKMTRKDIHPRAMSEYTIIEQLKTELGVK